jgi:hypothetical protein
MIFFEDGTNIQTFKTLPNIQENIFPVETLA